MYVGIDLGTSEVKAVLVDEKEHLHSSASIKLDIAHPHPGWSEQDPQAWWTATCEVMRRLRRSAPRAMAAVTAIGLSGQMHGAVLLDASGHVLRHAILWNDVRAAEQCALLEQLEPDCREITGNVAIPGYTAATLLWLKEHEPALFARIAKILLPKDYLGFRLTGEYVTDMSDASGTYWLDTGHRQWSEAMLAATGLDEARMPRLAEGCALRGILHEGLKSEWGLSGRVRIAVGGGDGPVAAVGVGAVHTGDALLSLGTSGVLMRISDRFLPNPAQGLKTHCHTLPGLWSDVSSTFSATASLAWAARLVRSANSAEFAQLAETANIDHAPLFLPHLSGYSTPHNDPHTQGAFFELTPQTDTAALAFSVLEGVAFSLAEGCNALRAGAKDVAQASFVGGGSRSLIWGKLIASICNLTLERLPDAAFIGAIGASRLARLAVSGESIAEVCRRPSSLETITPDAALYERLAPRYQRYLQLYAVLREQLHAPGQP